jgi:cell pole-organizing protein PopZ
MSATNPLSPPDRGAEQRALEPSMEEILASIRRIIADDHADEPVEAPPRSEPVMPEQSPDLQERLAAYRAAAAAPFMPLEPPEAAPVRSAEILGLHSVRAAVPAEAEPVPKLRAPPVPPAAPRLEAKAVATPAAPLLSAEADASVAASFNALLASHFMQNSSLIADMTRDMLRPMLKSWLDDNLPVIVERLVRAEIERVARGGR